MLEGKNMVSLIDLLVFFGTIAGIMFGASLGYNLGIICAILCSMFGGIIIFLFGRWINLIMLRKTYHTIAHLTSVELREQLHAQDCFIPNLILLELRFRGEDITSELPLIFNLMQSKYVDHRMRGFAAFLSAFPDMANESNKYNPTNSFEKCKKNVKRIENRVKLIQCNSLKSRKNGIRIK